MQVLGEDQDLGSGVLAADADVVELSGVAQGDGADGPDLVGADAVVGLGVAVAGGGFRPGGVGSCRGLAAGQRAVRPLVVVGGGELAGQCLQLGDGGGLAGLGGEPFLEGLLESFCFALDLGVVRLPVFCRMPRRRSSVTAGKVCQVACWRPRGNLV
jgi:hypothetical protein